MSKIKVGLVLSGGGAKGAYQVGVIKALSELGTEVHAVSGASIGALNGAILVSAGSLRQGAENLEQVWLTLANKSPVEVNKSVYLYLLVTAGLRFNPILTGIFATLSKAASRFDPDNNWLDPSVLSNQPLKEMLERHLYLDQLNQGMPFYVSLFKSQGVVLDIARILSAEFGIAENPKSEFIHLQSKPREEQQKYLLASAAIPILFSSQSINGDVYTDGGQGGWSKQQGNTPIEPLIAAGCNLVIVTHLNDGSLWSRHDYPETTILEIRPQQSISRHHGTLGGVKNVLGFNRENITSWIQQGYEDTKICLEQVMKLNQPVQELNQAHQQRESREIAAVAAQQKLEQAMSRLRSFKKLDL
ncbi:patatin-like phospholipase family protein [Vibrio metschnikovii]|nr:patatin-like phospholipase family protein [Vibrio metschnikovii]